MAASEEFIDTFYHSISDLHSARKSLNKEYSAELVEILQRAANDISNHTGKFLHKLHEKKPDEDTLKKMISASPSSLSYENEIGDLPICTAALSMATVRYVPFLAKEGVKHKVGGDDGRGGLLVQGEDGWNTFELLAIRFLPIGKRPEHVQMDKAYADVMKELKDASLLTKDDIKNYGLLYHTCNAYNFKQRFEFLCDWCPEGLKYHQYNDHLIIHAIIEYHNSIKSLAMFLKATMKHHTNEVGLLFQTDSNGIVACQRAFDRYGKKQTMQVIVDCIPFDDDNPHPQLPILHHVAKHAPQLLNDFSIRYRSAMYMRDEVGRNLNQVMLASGKTLYENNGLYFLHMLTDDHVREIDPVTDLYPFMVAASGNTSDLSAVYVLLRRNPSLVRGGNPENWSSNSSNRRRRRRRRSSTRTSNNNTKRKCNK